MNITYSLGLSVVSYLVWGLIYPPVAIFCAGFTFFVSMDYFKENRK